MRPRILVLHDAFAASARVDTADVLVEAAHVAGALEVSGYEAVVEPVGLDLGALEAALARHAPVAVFNLVESLAGRAELIHTVPALLEARGVPFTGAPAEALYASSNKRLAKVRLAAHGIRAPETFGGGAPRAGRWIVKSVWEHASFGLDDASVVAAEAVPAALARRTAEHGGHWFAEAFVPGRELNVALLAAAEDVLTLPVAEIRFDGFPPEKPKIVGYAAKWHEASFEYRHTPRSFGVEPALATRLADIAHACWRAFGLAGYARVDFRLDARGAIHVLEINANPCLSPDAGFAAALEQAGIGFTAAAAGLVEDALRRVRPATHAAAAQVR